MNPKKYFCVWLVLRDLKDGPKVVRYHRANQEMADLLLYLFSSVSSMSIVDEVRRGLLEDMEVIEAAKAASLPKLLRFVARGLQK